MTRMKHSGLRRPARPSRRLPYQQDGSPAGPRTLWCVDLRAVDGAWSQKPLDEVRFANRGGRLGSLFAGMDLDPRRTIAHNARALAPARARELFDALCEDLADTVLHDVPEPACRALLRLLCPEGIGESPYPQEVVPEESGPARGLVVLVEAALQAESAAVAISRALCPPAAGVPAADLPGSIDPILWSDILTSMLPMLEAVRDRHRSLLVEA